MKTVQRKSMISMAYAETTKQIFVKLSKPKLNYQHE